MQNNVTILKFIILGAEIYMFQTIQMKLTLLCVWAEPAFLDSAKNGLKLKHEI